MTTTTTKSIHRKKNNERYILGIQSFANMDSGASIVRCTTDGEVLDYIAISEERLIRIKHSYVFPIHSLGYCLDHFGIELGDIDVLVGDYIRLKRWFTSGPAYNTSDFDYLKLKLSVPPKKIVQIGHHEAHAASTFYTSGFDEAAILIVDGNGSDLETTSYFQGSGTELSFIENYKRHGIGAAYSVVSSRILGFGSGGEGKTMGLAPYGEAHPPVLDLKSKLDGIKNNFSDFMLRMPHSDVLNQIDPKNRINPLNKDYDKWEKGDDLLSPYFSRVAYEIQEEAERVLIHLANDLYDKTGSKNLCIAGGVGLNSVANKKILDNTPFENIFIFPACSDSGIPFGLAIWGYYNLTKELEIEKTRALSLENAYTGNEYREEEIESVFNKYGISYERVDYKVVAEKISQGKIVGWFQGRSEYGPRALGHRSILADPRRNDMKDVLNSRVKFRESFRPFAPSILREYASEYFELDCDSPYMLLISQVRKPESIPSVTHVDNTARVQTVSREANDQFYDLIEEFGHLTGVPCVLNTSFNVAGEPIVETPLDAVLCVLQTDMDYLAIGPFLMTKKEVKNLDQIVSEMSKERDDLINLRREELICKNFNGYDANERDMFISESNKMAEWHVRYRIKYELEKKVLNWAEKGSKLLIVGTPDHTQMMESCINGLKSLDIVGFLPFEGRSDKCESSMCSYPSLETDSITDLVFDEIVVSSYVYQYEILEWLESLHLSCPIHLLYDSSSRSLMETQKMMPSY